MFDDNGFESITFIVWTIYEVSLMVVRYHETLFWLHICKTLFEF